MKTRKYISIILTFIFALSLLFKGCGYTEQTDEITFRLFPGVSQETDLKATEGILKKRAENFGCSSTEVISSLKDNSISIRFQAKDSLSKHPELFTAKGELKFLPLYTRDQMQLSEKGKQLLKEWTEAGYLSESGPDNVVLNIPSAFTEVTAGILLLNEDQDDFLVIRSKDSNAGVQTFYLVEKASSNLTGKNVISTSCNDNSVMLTFDKEGTKLFAKLSGEQIGNGIAIIVDNVVLSSPVVKEAISGGRAMISGNFTQEEACLLSSVIGGGTLPATVNLEYIP